MSAAPDFDAVCDRVRALFSSSRHAMSLARYDVGVEVRRLVAGKDTYGTNAVGRLARQLGRSEDSLYEYATLAAAWSRAKFEEVAAHKTRRGIPLTLSHFLVIAGVPEVYRAELLALALARACSVRALAHEAAHVERAKPAEAPQAASLAFVLRRTVRSLRRTGTNLSHLVESLQGPEHARPSKRLAALLVQHNELADALANELSALAENSSAPAEDKRAPLERSRASRVPRRGRGARRVQRTRPGSSL